MYCPAFDTIITLTYNTWLRSLQAERPSTVGPFPRARNHYERSVNLSATTTKTQDLQRAAQSPAQPRCLEAGAPRCLPAMSRDAITSSGLSLMRHLSRHQGDRGRGQGQEEILIDHSIWVRPFPGRARAALLARPLLFLVSGHLCQLVGRFFSRDRILNTNGANIRISRKVFQDFHPLCVIRPLVPFVI